MPTTRSSLRTLTPQATLTDLGDENPANIVKPRHLRTPSAADLEKGVVADLGDLPPEPEVLEAEAKEAADDAFCVGWDVDDPSNPQNWSRRRRWALTILSSTVSVILSCGSLDVWSLACGDADRACLAPSAAAPRGPYCRSRGGLRKDEQTAVQEDSD